LSGRSAAVSAPPRGLLALLTAAAFLIFTQAFMIAPILPRSAQVFATTLSLAGLAVPAYLVPYGVMTLVWGPLSDRVCRRPVILASLVAFTMLTAATAGVDSTAAFIGIRLATAIAPALTGDLCWR
jgi:predicted MFS family arabinose efflux permease